ncbi:MAG: cardiolipin synthase B [Nitrospirae bacterium]|nr:cardiolipin synthase B [Nitrospirota bacterium]
MSDLHVKPSTDEKTSPVRLLAEQAFSRAAGAPLVAGNSVRILRDARENYPAWLEAIDAAKKTIHFENYIIHEDDIGNQFARALAARAQEGVRVRLIYDWLGALGNTSPRFWERLRKAGVEVRCYNPPQLDHPLSWLSRDHRKMIAVDGRIGFVTGLCIGLRWVGSPKRSIEPWRDTGVEVRGPAVSDIEHAFADVWAETGSPLPEDELPERGSLPRAGDMALRVVASVPNTGGLYRLDHLIAVLARKNLWLTDAYFVGMTPYVQALRTAVRDGVDVRLLVPGTNDIPVLRAFSRAGYQPLLEAGIRVFEWNGSMLHAKTAVADGRWARVGSTNLNMASWIGNYELDVAVEDETFAKTMEQMYLEDIAHSTEIILSKRSGVRLAQKRPGRFLGQRGRGEGTLSRAGAGAIRIKNAVGAAVSNQRILGPAEARMMSGVGLVFLALGLTSVFWPRLVTIPLALLCGWLGVSLLISAYQLHRKRSKDPDK